MRRETQAHRLFDRPAQRAAGLLATAAALALSLSCAAGRPPLDTTPETQRSDGNAPAAPGAKHDAVVERPEISAVDSSGGITPGISRETTPDRTRREDPPGQVVEVREQMEEAYQEGLEDYQSGRFDEAKDHFDQAVETVLGSGIDLSGQPALKKAFDEMVRNIADMDADLYTRESESQGRDNGSPLDELKDITTYLSPEEAERERQKIQRLAGQVSYDVPIVLNQPVLSMVEAFQTRIRKEFEAGLKRSGAYLPLIKKIFREAGLPEDLAYMAHQESAFKNNAYSRARAKGMWQFMTFTGRKYGLKRDTWIDERSDFEKATRSAVAYLKDLYERYGDWYLAMAAYNAGEGKIDRAIRHSGKKDYWHLTKTRTIRRETKYYVPAILASILIDKSPEDYGFDVEIDPPLRWETIELDRPTDLQVIAEGTGVSLEEIRALNPELRGLITPPNVPAYTARIPEGTRADLMTRLETVPEDKRATWTVYETRPGETFSTIARRYKVSVRALLEANPRYAGARLRQGTVLNIPLAGATPGIVTASAREDRPTYEAGERLVHRVRRGETLQAISGKYRTTVANLKRWNNLNGSIIRSGQRVVVYYGEKGDGPQPDFDPDKTAVSVADGRLSYKVQRGDTLHSIARKFSAALEDLCRWNNLTIESVIRPGDRIMVGDAPAADEMPPGEAAREGTRQKTIKHRVRAGETLTRIAQRYDVSVHQVIAWNGLDDPSAIHPGQVLTIVSR
jgi:membrane-bound lytic murein transglycosylase D